MTMKKLCGFAVGISLLAFTVPASAQTANDCYQATLKTDDQAIIRICTQALDRGGLSNEDRSITTSNRGLGYLRIKEYDKAIIDFSEALLINPKNPYSFNFRGECWREKGNFERALADFESALNVNPDFTGAFYNRGLTYERQGKIEDARSEYNKGLQTKGDTALDKWARARIQERLTALGGNPQRQQQTTPRNDNPGPRRDSDNNDRTPQRQQQQNNPGNGTEGSYIRRR
ncbi:MAG: tetratricopeptide repeat protein [Xanthobacteraceae bacterium]|nr:tetratricopeptide repeat protein [Xanthobacteraceae bacterium]MCW5674478.1 tetratricopeptide repeat protein [Xanthobacteraceae bacterium]